MKASLPSKRDHRVLIVEDDPATREALVDLCRSDLGLAVLAATGLAAEGCRLVARPHDLLLLDLGLPDGSGYDVLSAQRQQRPSARCLVLTVFADRAHVLRALELGAHGYCLKQSRELANAILQALAGQLPLDSQITAHLIEPLRKPVQQAPAAGGHLTLREHETLSGLARGLSYREIAAELSISPNTVTDYVKTLYRKLAVSSRSQAVYIAHQRGLIDF